MERTDLPRARKLFAMFANNHHGDGRIAVWCNAPSARSRISWLLIRNISSFRPTSE